MCTFFFFNDTATTEIYTLSLHDALPISHRSTLLFHHEGSAVYLNHSDPGARFDGRVVDRNSAPILTFHLDPPIEADRKSTRLNSSHLGISYAVFCLKKKKKQHIRRESTT